MRGHSILFYANTVTKGTDKKTRPILSDDERNELLKCYFNIEVV